MAETRRGLKADIVVVGGGIAGLLSAQQLAESGANVTIIERGNVGQEASWAGGGIVSPLYAWRYDKAVSTLAHWSQAVYPSLCHALEEKTGVDPQCNPCGLLILDAPDTEEALAWAQRNERSLTVLDRDQFAPLEPKLSDAFQTGLWMPGVANIRNPLLMQAVKESIALNPRITLRENCEMLGFLRQGDQVYGLETSIGNIDCEKVLVTTGAWTAGLIEQLAVQVPIEPVKGQMLLIKAQPGVVRRIVLSEGRYVIPRIDGHVLVGSSLEKTGFEKNITDQARMSLADFAYHLIPQLKEYPIVNHWAGLRPGSPMGVPFIGAVPVHNNVFVNAGHFRNGVVMAPASARLVADLMLGIEPEIDPAPYQIVQR